MGFMCRPESVCSFPDWSCANRNFILQIRNLFGLSGSRSHFVVTQMWHQDQIISAAGKRKLYDKLWPARHGWRHHSWPARTVAVAQLVKWSLLTMANRGLLHKIVFVVTYSVTSCLLSRPIYVQSLWLSIKFVPMTTLFVYLLCIQIPIPNT